MANENIFEGYGWLKEKILNDEGRKQQNQLRELTNLAATFDCTVGQLAIGMSLLFADEWSFIFL